MSKFSIDNETKLAEIETHLANNQYLSGGANPDANDAQILLALNQQPPNKEKYPNFYFWFANCSILTKNLLEHIAKKASAPAKKDDDDDDLFGSDDEEDAKKLEEMKKKKAEEAKKAKKKVIAKSIVIFDVKVFEQEQDLDELAKRILGIEIEGLMWRTEYKLVEIAFGMKKIQMGCTIEDDKVSTDDLFDKILAWEDEVQSVDIVSFQKVWDRG